jgi:hypothetical protein
MGWASLAIFWRLSGASRCSKWLARAKSRATASVSGTEGQRLESSRARLPKRLLAGSSVGRTPKVKQSRPRLLRRSRGSGNFLAHFLAHPRGWRDSSTRGRPESGARGPCTRPGAARAAKAPPTAGRAAGAARASKQTSAVVFDDAGPHAAASSQSGVRVARRRRQGDGASPIAAAKASRSRRIGISTSRRRGWSRGC